MTTEKVTNPYNQCPSLLEDIVTYSCLNEVSEKSISRRDATVILYFPTNPDHSTVHAEVLGGPVLCPALLCLITSPHGYTKMSVLTDIVLGWVIDRHHTWIILFNIHRDYKNTTDDYSLKNDDMNSWPPPFLKGCHSFFRVKKMILTQPPPSFLHDIILFTVFFGGHS